MHIAGMFCVCLHPQRYFNHAVSDSMAGNLHTDRLCIDHNLQHLCVGHIYSFGDTVISCTIILRKTEVTANADASVGRMVYTLFADVNRSDV